MSEREQDERLGSVGFGAGSEPRPTFSAGSEPADDPRPAFVLGSAQARNNRRLLDKVVTAFHQACDQLDLDVADQLVRILESMLTRRTPPDTGRRRGMEMLVAAHERLWHLRHGSQGDDV